MIILIGIALQWLLGLWDLIEGREFNFGYMYVTIQFAVIFGSSLAIFLYFMMDKGQVRIIDANEALTIEYTSKSIACKSTPRTLVIRRGELLQVNAYNVLVDSKHYKWVKAPKLCYELKSGFEELKWTTPVWPLTNHKDFTPFLKQYVITINEETNTYQVLG